MSATTYTFTPENSYILNRLGANNGIAELDSSGKVPASQLPSYVDDVVEANTRDDFPVTGESGKIYVDLSTNKTYRWGGSSYVEISESLALGETESTAYRGDRGKIAYDHAQAKGSNFSLDLYKIETNSEGHVTRTERVQNATTSAPGLMSAADKTKLDFLNGGVEAYSSFDLFPATGESEKMYIDTSESVIYYWNGSEYIAISSARQTVFADIPFSIGLNDWVQGNGVYTYSVTNTVIISQSKFFVIFDKSVKNLTSGAEIDLDTSGSQPAIVFTVTSIPLDTVSGKIYCVNYDAERIPVQVIDGTVPIAAGGTGSSSAVGARTNLGLGNAAVASVANNLTTAEPGSVLDAYQGMILNNSKMNKVSSATNGDFAVFDSNGNVVDSGKSSADFLPASASIPVEKGGTGATTASDARTNLGLGSVENKSSATIRSEITKSNVDNAISIGSDTTKFYRNDGSWAVPANATTSSAGYMSSDDKVKLEGIETGAQVNPGEATTSSSGLMSASDKTKLDGVASGATANTVENSLTSTSTTNALSAAQGKTLNDTKAPIADPNFTGSISLGRIANSTIGSGSVAEGGGVTASGAYSHAEGGGTTASGQQAHAEGGSTTASGALSHAEGSSTTASGSDAHAEGSGTTASGDYSHSEGAGTRASGNYSHSEGGGTTASGDYSHSEGAGTTASGKVSHSEGSGTTAAGNYSHSEGYGNKVSTKTIDNKTYTGTGAHGANSHSEGASTWSIGSSSHAEGVSTTAYGANSHSEGYSTWAIGACSHAEGASTTASGQNAHAEGYDTTASGDQSHAEGSGTTASGHNSHAEGYSTTASGVNSHAEGFSTTASGANSHAGGSCNITDSYDNWPEWVADTSYDVGDKVKITTGSGASQTVNGYICKTANSDSTFTASKWNGQYGKMNYAEIIGNGLSNSSRSNARALDWDGNEHLMGDLYVGCNADSTGGTKVATSSEVNALSAKIGDIDGPNIETQLKTLSGVTSQLQDEKISNPSNVPAGKFLQTDSNGNAVWGDAGSSITVENNLTSTSTTNALSAAQGKVLNDTKAPKDAPVITSGVTIQDPPAHSQYPAFELGVEYNEGDIVSFNGKTYECMISTDDEDPTSEDFWEELDTFSNAIEIKNESSASVAKINWYGDMEINGALKVNMADGSGYDIGQLLFNVRTGLSNGLAYVSDGNSHQAISSGKYIYIKNHSSLPEGIYAASSNIAANAALSYTNVISLSSAASYGGGALNELQDGFATSGTRATVAQLTTSATAVNYTASQTGYYTVLVSTGTTGGTCSAIIQNSSGNTLLKSTAALEKGDNITCGLLPLKAGATIKAVAIFPSGGNGILVRIF